jgi:hypothetical protein
MTPEWAKIWLSLNPRPIATGEEEPSEYTTRLEDWIFHYSLACEAIGDERRDNR